VDFDGRAPTPPGKNGNSNGNNGRHNGNNGRNDASKPGAQQTAAATTAGGAPRRRPVGARPTQDAPLTELLTALRAVRQGDFGVRLSVGSKRGAATGSLMLDIAHEFNAIISLNEAMANEMVRVERVVGREGRMTERATLHEMRGGWGSSVGSINALIGDLVQPTTEVARHQRRRRGRFHAEDGVADRGPAGQGRVPAHRHHGQQHG
jgi:hypothetical protein